MFCWQLCSCPGVLLSGVCDLFDKVVLASASDILSKTWLRFFLLNLSKNLNIGSTGGGVGRFWEGPNIFRILTSVQLMLLGEGF